MDRAVPSVAATVPSFTQPPWFSLGSKLNRQLPSWLLTLKRRGALVSPS